MTSPRRFVFLNQTQDLSEHGWDDPGLDKLWRYNLHYFDDLNAEGASDRRDWHRALLVDWIAANPPGRGTGWEPYPTSLRIVNWVKWALAGNQLTLQELSSLAIQARWLAKRMELHLLGNHLLANAKALVFAGSYFAGAEADFWLEKGVKYLRREITEQIHDDGGHFELSPMYHSLIVDDLLDICNLARVYQESASLQAAGRDALARIPAMLEWMFAMTHPDGQLAFFNDSALGIALTAGELAAYAESLGIQPTQRNANGLRVLPQSGYVRVASGEYSALMDVGEIGPAYLPAHAHADTLSFELSLFGHRVLVNSGTSCYGKSAERTRQRGTAAHNTVVVGGVDSSEVWAGFRAGHRAHPRDVRIESDIDVTISASHDGYKRLNEGQFHTRSWYFQPHLIVIEDMLTPGGSAMAEAFFHLHPDFCLDDIAIDGSKESVKLTSPCGEITFAFSTQFRLEPSTWHPEFGVSEPSYRLVVPFSSNVLRTTIGWQRTS